MSQERADSEADIPAPEDRGEPVSLMEPLLIGEDSRHRAGLSDLALELGQKSAGLRRSLSDALSASLAELMRAMNCYYSNLIEGHETHPVDIERALRNDYSTDPKKRNLQLEAKAHVTVQQWIDAGGLAGPPIAVASLCDIHRRFCELLPNELLQIADPGQHEQFSLVPGRLRRRDVEVGRHLAISPGAVPRFLSRFENVYGRLGKSETVLAAAAAHHRFLWIHPFLDGNGRVARLMSHATLLEVLDTGALWSIARGLARNVQAYKAHLVACDQRRRNDLDGRGSLSEEALAEFTRFFLSISIDQVSFIESLVEPRRLRARILLWNEEEIRLNRLPPRSGAVLEAILYRGELPRGEVASLVGTGDRQARRIVAALTERGALVSAGPRSPLRLAFPPTLAQRWLPGLFPERPA